MIEYEKKFPKMDKMKALVTPVKGTSQKLRLKAVNVAKKLYVRTPKTKPKLSLFADTVHNNSFINFCKKEEKKRMKKLQRPIEL